MATDDKKASPAPENSVVETKEIATKKGESQLKDKSAPETDYCRPKGAITLPTRLRVIVEARAKRRSREHIGITGTPFWKRIEKEAIVGRWQVSERTGCAIFLMGGCDRTRGTF